MKTSRSPHRTLISLLAFAGMFFSIGTMVPSAAGNIIENFPAGVGPCGIAFDGANIWVANYSVNGTVTKLRASDGVILDSVPLGANPFWTTFGGENVCVG